MNEEAIIIRDITDPSEMRAVEDLQIEVWRMSERDIVSVFMLAATNAVGGILVGAFARGTLVGFAYGFPGLEGGNVIMHSDMLAVRADYRARGVGFRLKLAQRERALARGIGTMTWTFDPLQATNAHLNFSKLGVVSDSYRVNFYGEQSSSILHQTGTDRLWLTWPLASARVRARIEGRAVEDTHQLEGAHALLRVGANEEPLNEEAEPTRHEHVIIEIPARINDLQKRKPEAARLWRLATRKAFTESIAAGHVVRDFYRRERDGQRFGVYLLTRGRLEDFLRD